MSKVKVVLSICLLALLTGLFAPNLYADDVLFNTAQFPGCADLQKCADVSFPIQGNSNDGGTSSAAAFGVNGSYTLTSVAAVLNDPLTASATVDFYLFSGPGDTPDVDLGELGSVTVTPDEQNIYTVDPSTSISLTSGIQYWLVLAGDASNSSSVGAGWYVNGDVAGVDTAITTSDVDSGPDWIATEPDGITAPQFTIYGTPIVTTPPGVAPEPASAWLLLSAFGLGGLTYGRRLNWSR